MNTIVTSKEAILKASRQLIQTEGWKAVNIRSVAKECNISVGTIYNYFNSKADLVTATVESIWCDIFHFPDDRNAFHSFSGCIEWAFDCMKKGDVAYPGFFSLHSMSFMGSNKSDAQRLMVQSWDHIRRGLLQVLFQDPKVRPNAFDSEFTPEKFVDIIFSLFLSALLRNDYDCTGILGMVQRILY